MVHHVKVNSIVEDDERDTGDGAMSSKSETEMIVHL